MSVSTLILGDSLVRELPDNSKYSKLFYPGIDCRGLSEKISVGELDKYLRSVSLVILLIGTNDVPLSFPDRVARKILSVALVLRGRFRGLTVAIAGIIPRLSDNGIYQYATKFCNKSLEAIVTGDSHIKLLRSYRAFLSWDAPRRSHLSVDGLHLSEQGLKALYRGFMSAIYSHEKTRL